MKETAHIWLIWVISLFLFHGCVPDEERPQASMYIESLEGIHAGAFFQEGLRGEGIRIGILDIGFGGLGQDTTLSHLIRNGQIMLVKDFLPDQKISVYASPHGSMVLRYMAGIDPTDSIFGGSLARDALFYLVRPVTGAGAKADARTDEMKIDSAFMLLHDLGVRLVNLSLGFWNEFAEPDENYSPEQMDGQTTIITRICRKWAQKGMIIVNSAGNTGEYSWRYIWAPGDAREVITVGADRFSDKVFKSSYSGRGNPAVPFVKPDLIIYSPYGTSFSAPLITGVVACMLQKDSLLTPDRVRSVLHRASTLYPFPNNYVGYGIPDAGKILKLLGDSLADVSSVKVIRTIENEVVLTGLGREAVVFEKQDAYVVRRQTIRHTDEGTLTLTRKKGRPQTTVTAGLDKAWEIFWE